MTSSSRYVIAFSGGKDSTALALKWHELARPAVLLHTPTGDEYPDLVEHVNTVAKITGYDLEIARSPRNLYQWINYWKRLPNHRQRWCTRLLKIQPCQEWIALNGGHTLLVGLRADEPDRAGIYSDTINTHHPLQEWGWGLQDVIDYNQGRGVTPPKRTDCQLCFFQRLVDWYRLWRDHPEAYARGVALEHATGYTFRSPHRDTQPASLQDLRAKFEMGYMPSKAYKNDDDDDWQQCRVCSL